MVCMSEICFMVEVGLCFSVFSVFPGTPERVLNPLIPIHYIYMIQPLDSTDRYNNFFLNLFNMIFKPIYWLVG